MIRLAAALLALVALAGCGQADRAADLPPPDPALWEVTLADGTPAGHLFGTIHALPEGASWRTPAIDKAIAGADLLVVEVKDLDNARKLSAAFTRLSRSPEGLPPLTERVPGALRGRLRALLAEGRYSEADFRATETWAAALTLAQLANDSLGENGVDRALLRDFRAREVVELEGVVGQFAIFDALPEADQRDLLGAVIEDDAIASGVTTKLVRLWLTGDMEAIRREGDEGMLADPGLREALLERRNRDWAERIGALYANGRKPFVAVGAAHLAPPEGLAELLAAKGYRVRRVH